MSAFAADGCWQVRLGKAKSQVKAADVTGVINPKPAGMLILFW